MKFEKGKYKNLMVQLYDDDWGIDDTIGYCNVDWMPCIENSGKWMVNKIYDLDGPAKLMKKFPEAKFG